MPCEQCDELRERVRQLEALLRDDGAPSYHPSEDVMSPPCARRVFRLLMSKPGSVFTWERVAAAASWYRAPLDQLQPRKSADVALSKTRAALRELNMPYEIVTVWGHGWRILQREQDDLSPVRRVE